MRREREARAQAHAEQHQGINLRTAWARRTRDSGAAPRAATERGAWAAALGGALGVEEAPLEGVLEAAPPAGALGTPR